MKRSFVLTLVLCLFTSAAYADGNPLSAMWPFGNAKAKTPAFDAGRFSNPAAKKKTGLPSPSGWIDRAEKSTNAAFKKTRETWKGMQNFGKSLNPFVANSTGPKKQKKSLLDWIMPKQPVSKQPSTVNEFLSMDRPKY